MNTCKLYVGGLPEETREADVQVCPRRSLPEHSTFPRVSPYYPGRGWLPQVADERTRRTNTCLMRIESPAEPEQSQGISCRTDMQLP